MTSPCSLGVGCDETGVCYALAHGQPDKCGREDDYPGQAPCPNCFESSGYMARCHPDTWSEPGWAEPDPLRPCPHCNGTGTVDSLLVTLEDLEDQAEEERT